MKRAIIEAGVVVNIIDADESFAPPGVVLVDVTADTRMGSGWDGAVFSPPPPMDIIAEREMMVATLAQFRIALDEAGLLAAFQTKVASDPRAVAILQFGGTISRNSPLIVSASGGAVTDEQIDDIFRAAMVVAI